MKIMITPMMLCDMLGGKFTLEACEAICEYYEEFCGDMRAPAIGDIMCLYAEVKTEDIEDETVMATLKNGNSVVFL